MHLSKLRLVVVGVACAMVVGMGASPAWGQRQTRFGGLSKWKRDAFRVTLLFLSACLRKKRKMERTCLVAAMSALIAASAFAGEAIPWTNDPAGGVANGYVSVHSPLASFTDSVGAGLFIFDFGVQSFGNALAVFSDFDDSELIIDFTTNMQALSLWFGNDDPNFSQPGDEAVLTVFLGNLQVGQVSVVMNRDDVMNQMISISGVGPFDRATFKYDVNPAIGLIEIVDDLQFEQVQDTDDDGIPDDEDDCPDSNLTATIVIDGCDSGVANLLFDDGCTMADLIDECADGAANHGQFVSCVALLTIEWRNGGLINGREKGRIQSCAARSNIPGDLDGDGAVGVADLVMLLGAWGLCPAQPDACPGDVDLDDIVGISDLLMLLANWG